ASVNQPEKLPGATACFLIPDVTGSFTSGLGSSFSSMALAGSTPMSPPVLTASASDVVTHAISVSTGHLKPEHASCACALPAKHTAPSTAPMKTGFHDRIENCVTIHLSTL